MSLKVPLGRPAISSSTSACAHTTTASQLRSASVRWVASESSLVLVLVLLALFQRAERGGLLDLLVFLVLIVHIGRQLGRGELDARERHALVAVQHLVQAHVAQLGGVQEQATADTDELAEGEIMDHVMCPMVNRPSVAASC